MKITKQVTLDGLDPCIQTLPSENRILFNDLSQLLTTFLTQVIRHLLGLLFRLRHCRCDDFLFDFLALSLYGNDSPLGSDTKLFGVSFPLWFDLLL